MKIVASRHRARMAAVAGLTAMGLTLCLSATAHADDLAAGAEPLADVLEIASSSDIEGAVSPLDGNASETEAASVLPDSSDEAVARSTSSGETVSVSLPFAEESSPAVEVSSGVFAYDNRNGSQTVASLKADGSVQMTTVLEDALSPTEFAYDFALPEGATIHEENGALFFLDLGGAVIGGVAPAWAVDAKGQAVSTHYEVRGTEVTQFVEAGPDTAYPVIADPLWGTNLIDKASWILRGSVVSLSLVPSGWMRFNAAFGPAITEGWKEALAKTPTKTINGKVYNRTKANTTQMYWQFQCHQVIAFVKPEWNLEPSNYRPSYAAYSANGCN